MPRNQPPRPGWSPRSHTARRAIATVAERSEDNDIVLDVAIVGGGPAGSVCAWLLRQLGAEVAVWERRGTPRPRFHEIIAPAAHPFLHRFGLGPIAEQSSAPCLGILRRWHGPDIELHTYAKPGFILDRRTFDARCRDRARAAGVRWIDDNLRDLRKHGGQWQLQGKHCNGRCRFLIDASGRAGLISRRLGGELATGDPTIAVGVSYPTAETPSPHLRIERVSNGWWYFVDREGRTDAVHVSPRQARRRRRLQGLLIDNLGTSPWARAAHLQQAAWSRPQAQDATPRARLAAGEDWLAIGDAAAAFDPITSQGVTNGLSTSWFAVRALEDYLRGEMTALETYAAAVYLTWERTLEEQDAIQFWRSPPR